MKPEWKELVKHNSGIEIGTSDVSSKTFLPKVEYHQNNLLFVDVAGLNDSGGVLMDMLNRFTLRYLF